MTALTLLAQGKLDLWATSQPSLISILLIAALVVTTLVIVMRMLRSPADSSLPVGPHDEELSAIQRARASLERELEAVDGTLRGALALLLDEPLQLVDERVEALLAAGRSFASQPPPGEQARLLRERERLRGELEREEDPRARSLMQASLQDLDRTRDVQRGLACDARLVRLELDRLRTLLESLPPRIREVSARQILRSGELQAVEAIASQLEQAVRSTSDIVEDVLTHPPHPLGGPDADPRPPSRDPATPARGASGPTPAGRIASAPGPAGPRQAAAGDRAR